MKLPLPEDFSWLVLSRVRSGGVTKLGDRYLENGRPLDVLLAEILDELLQRGLLEVTSPDPADNLARVRTTETGQAHYRTLGQQQTPLPVPPPQFTTTTSRTTTPPPTNAELACVELPTEPPANHQLDPRD